MDPRDIQDYPDKKMALFVGGPFDGTRRVVENNQRRISLHAYPHDLMNFVDTGSISFEEDVDTAHYVRHPIAGQEKEWLIYGPEGWTVDEVFGHLFKNYFGQIGQEIHSELNQIIMGAIFRHAPGVVERKKEKL